MKRLIIAIDGPSAAGKSTVGKLLARKCEYMYIDTGALYRAIGLVALRKGIDPQNEDEVFELLSSTRLGFCLKNGQSHVTANGEDIEDKIRTEEVGKAASHVSAHKKVRHALLGIQRDIGKNGGIIMDGRDIGTVIFPHADVKFFLYASPEIRGRRRWMELKSKDCNIKEEDVLQQVMTRDKNDSSRQTAPLRKAHDAIAIDSSHMNVEEVVQRMLNYISNYTH